MKYKLKSWTIKKIKCSDCIYKFECLAKHHIPKNYGNNCKKYKRISIEGN